MTLKAFKFRLSPNKTQQILINKTLGCARLIYNKMLDERQTKYKNKDKSSNLTEKQYKELFSFLKEVDSISLQQARIDLFRSYQNFFRNIKQHNKTGLKFKSRKNPKNSYRTISSHNNIRIIDNKIKLPKLGFIKFKKSREVTGIIKSVTITRTILNKYYISVLCETEISILPELDKNVGIDLGLTSFLVTSDNIQKPNPKHLTKSLLKLTKIQKRFSRKHKGSNRKAKYRHKLYRIHEKIANQRTDFLHKLSTKIINENQVICLEDLDVKSMLQNKQLARSISDVSWSKFVNMLIYKANWYGRSLVQIDKYFPSSKLCSCCGHIKKDLQLSDRTYICDQCGLIIDRDYNAAINILVEGLRILQNRRDDGVSSVNNKELSLSS